MMEQKILSLDTETLLESYRELLETAEELPLLVTGNSMLPFLVHRRDTVWLTGVDRELKRGDIVLYRRRSGGYILHRIVRVEGGCYTMAGDGQHITEPGITGEQIMAVVCAARRKGKRQEPGCFWWDFFEKVWVRMVPLRRPVLKVYGLANKLFRRKR